MKSYFPMMLRSLPPTAALCYWLASAAAAADLAMGDRTFSFPDDYSLEVAAGPPLVERPMEADFDPRGRLYVTESSGSNEPVEEQLKKRPHRVLRLTDSDGDGIFDRRTVFADGLMFPEGCLWHEGSVYVAAPPQIWKLTDADDDGVAEKREVWFDGKTLTGCANDLHGPYRGPDGWIYWCKGAFAEQTYDLPGRPGWKTTAAHVFRARAGASGPESLEPVFTAGMDNPVGLAWTPEGDLIVAGTFLQHPGNGRRDGLIHAVRGGVWGKDHDVLDTHPRTGPLMPAMTHLGPAAPAGLTRYGRDLLCAQFNMRTVSRHALTPEGATYTTTDTDFLTCDHPDFHPTDVLQAPDGSVLVIDTGGWYKLCCPTSQVAKPKALGAIYRLRRKAGELPVEPPPPRWPAHATHDPATAMADLAHPDPHLRRRAAEALATQPDPQGTAVAALLHALEAPDIDRFLFHSFTNALREIGHPAATRSGLAHPHPAVRAATLYALEQMPGGAVVLGDVLPALDDNHDRTREAAHFVLARHPEWADPLASWIESRLAAPDAGGEPLRRVLSALGAHPRIRAQLGAALTADTPAAARQQILETMVALRLPELPDPWRPGLNDALTHGTPSEQAAALTVIRQASPQDRAPFTDGLARLARDPQTPAETRLAALATAAGPLNEEAFAFAMAHLTDAAAGSTAAEVLASRPLDPPQLRRLATRFPDAGLLERPALLKAFAGQSDEAAGLALVAALDHTRTLAATPPDTLRVTFSGFPPSVHTALAVAREKSQPPDQAARLAELEATLPPGDPERGLVVFQTPKAACATCHPLGYKGGTLGPDLGKVGAIRTRRDLIEAIVFPSASFVRSYEPVRITRHDGTPVYGIITAQGGDALTVATGPAVPPTRIPRPDIKDLASGTFSLMPQGIDQILSSQELADLLAYLQSRQ
jgi:putative membrane-bound dehydrogenase-like protein